MSFKSSGLVVLIHVKYSDVLKRNHATWFVTVDDLKRVGDIPVIPIEADLVEDLFDELDADDAVDINSRFTNAFVCEVGRKILDREFGIFDMFWLELKRS